MENGYGTMIDNEDNYEANSFKFDFTDFFIFMIIIFSIKSCKDYHLKKLDYLIEKERTQKEIK